MTVVVVSDSSARLGDAAGRWGIREVPLHVLVDGADLRDGVDDPEVLAAITMLGVEPLLRTPNAAYVAAHLYRLQELTAARRIAEVKSRLQRTNPVDQAVDYNKMFGELVALEQHRRTLREAAVGHQ